MTLSPSEYQVEGSEDMPLRAELGNRGKAGEKSSNLEETGAEGG